MSVLALGIAALAAVPEPPDALRAEISKAVSPRQAVVAFASDDTAAKTLAESLAPRAQTPLGVAEAVYEAIAALIDQGRILRDPDNRPKARLPHTGVEVLRAALDDDSSPLPAGCYELSSAFIAASRAAGIPVFGMDAAAPGGTIGHIVAGLETGGGRPMIFDLQNGVRERRDDYRPLTDRELAAHHYNHLAVARYLRGELEAARIAVDDAIRVGGTKPPFLNNRAATLARQGELWAARAEIAHAIAAAPRDSVFRYQWGLIAFDLGLVEEAARAFDSVLTLEPGHAEARRERALAFAAAGRSEDAERQLRALLGAGAAPSGTREALVAVLVSRGARAAARDELARVKDEEARRELGRWLASGITEPGSGVDRVRRLLRGGAP